MCVWGGGVWKCSLEKLNWEDFYQSIDRCGGGEVGIRRRVSFYQNSTSRQVTKEDIFRNVLKVY